MDHKDLKRINVILTSSLTLFLEALINAISSILIRQILSPIAVLISFFIAFFITHRIKCYSYSLMIKRNEEEAYKISDPKEIEALLKQNSTLRKGKSKLELSKI